MSIEGPTKSNVTVNYATSNGVAANHATAGSDYTSTSGALTFTPGGPLVQTVSVPVLDDTTFEADADEITRARAIWSKVQERFAKEAAMPEIITQDDVADAALFLASDLSRKISGQVLLIDGGMSSSRMMPMI